MPKNRKNKEVELSQEELDIILAKIAEFDDNSFATLAETDKYEIIPTMLEDGRLLDQKDMNMLKQEIKRLGYKILYRIDNPNGETLLINPNSNKIMVLKEGMQ